MRRGVSHDTPVRDITTRTSGFARGLDGRRRNTFRLHSLFTRFFMRSKFIKWFFIVGLLGSGTVYSALILVLFPFAGRSGRYWLDRKSVV